MEHIYISQLNTEEKSKLIEDVDGDNAGCGIIHNGKYYVLAYRPLKDMHTYKCNGVELFINKREGSPKNDHYAPNTAVKFKESWLSIQKTPFKDRLETVIKQQTDFVISLDKEIDDRIARVAKEKKDREDAIRNYTEKIRSCQLKIDSTVKTIAPKAKSVMEINHARLLAETTAKEESAKEESNTDTEPPFHSTFSGSVFEQGFEPIEQHIIEEKEYVSEKEKQHYINDSILHTRFNKRQSFKWKSQHSPISYPQEDRASGNSNIVNVDVISQDDPRYLTDLERMNANKKANPKLTSPNILR